MRIYELEDLMSADADTTEGKILRELGGLRSDFQEMRAHSDARHRTLANEMAELRSMATRAVETAADAKRLADSSAHEMRDTQRALVEHTRGLAARQQTVEASVEVVKKETTAQTASLATLLTAETERKIREDERTKQDDARWKWIGRAWPILTAAAMIAAWAIGHWKP